MNSLGFNEKEKFPTVLENAKSKSNNVVEQLAYIVLSHPKYKQRSFDAIKERFRGLPDEELKLILLSIGAIRFVSLTNEFWGQGKKFPNN